MRCSVVALLLLVVAPVVMQVNVYGPYRVTKAFMPLLVARKGRIVNIALFREFSQAAT